MVRSLINSQEYGKMFLTKPVTDMHDTEQKNITQGKEEFNEFIKKMFLRLSE